VDRVADDADVLAAGAAVLVQVDGDLLRVAKLETDDVVVLAPDLEEIGVASSLLIYYCAPRIVMWSSLKIRLYSSVVLPSFAALAT
jgi:hypothetical protein